MALRSDPLLIGVNFVSLLRIQGNLGKKNGTCVLLNVCSMAVSSQYMLAEPFTVFVMLN